MQSLDALKQELTGDGVNCTEKRFRSDEGISGLGAEIFVSDKEIH